MAGAVAAAVTTPLDVCKTLLQTRGLSSEAQIRNARGLSDAFRIIYQRQGLMGFSRGMTPRILTNMPSNALCCQSRDPVPGEGAQAEPHSAHRALVRRLPVLPQGRTQQAAASSGGFSRPLVQRFPPTDLPALLRLACCNALASSPRHRISSVPSLLVRKIGASASPADHLFPCPSPPCTHLASSQVDALQPRPVCCRPVCHCRRYPLVSVLHHRCYALRAHSVCIASGEMENGDTSCCCAAPPFPCRSCLARAPRSTTPAVPLTEWAFVHLTVRRSCPLELQRCEL